MQVEWKIDNCRSFVDTDIETKTLHMLVPLHQNNTTSRCLARSAVCFEIVTLNDSPAMRPLRPKRVLYNRTYGSYFFAPVFDMQKGISMQYQNIILEFKKISVPRFDLSLKSEKTQDCGDARTHTHIDMHPSQQRKMTLRMDFHLIPTSTWLLSHSDCLPQRQRPAFWLSFPRTSMIFSITLAASTMLPWYISRFYIWFGCFFPTYSWMKRCKQVKKEAPEPQGVCMDSGRDQCWYASLKHPSLGAQRTWAWWYGLIGAPTLRQDVCWQEVLR